MLSLLGNLSVFKKIIYLLYETWFVLIAKIIISKGYHCIKY